MLLLLVLKRNIHRIRLKNVTCGSYIMVEDYYYYYYFMNFAVETIMRRR